MLQESLRAALGVNRKSSAKTQSRRERFVDVIRLPLEHIHRLRRETLVNEQQQDDTEEQQPEVIKLVANLPVAKLLKRLDQASEANDMSKRMLSFYLADMHRRRVHILTGHKSTRLYAHDILGIPTQRTIPARGRATSTSTTSGPQLHRWHDRRRLPGTRYRCPMHRA